ncbi:dioxygenase [Aspergillus ibericus CBS 121593]|uniref:Dioxygenase n=1 Tax=Aspergillus ibericus CBS 121593 TaxID=1448316 RepID=A0A395H0N4_9EURO|nr:dioxygenase [Aspergillus ibericus CBS 121593]RAL00865.1 dioxygenase [Aspergillus ibericus CBS 121593]
MSSASQYTLTLSPPTLSRTAPESASDKNHWVRDATGNAKSFVNPWPSSKDFTFPEIFRDMIQHKFFSGNSQKPDTAASTVSVVKPTFLASRTGSSVLRATWLGHACYFVEFPTGLRVLFDPVFEERCSPFSWIGHRRFTERPCDVSDIPIIDCVIISHSHYDHLSYPTVMDIHKHHPSAQFFVPKGLKKWFTDCGIQNAVELDWWEDITLTLTPHKSTAEQSSPDASAPHPSDSNEITATISCLPTQHTSARTPFNKATTLWASWSITSGTKSIYFAGDTGYRTVPYLPPELDDWGREFAHLPVCPAFKEIGEFRGPFDLGLIPIGAYKPRHVLSTVHSNPFDAVEIFKDTRCRRAMGIHWGTWAVAEEDVMEPPGLLRRALKRSGVDERGVFDVCDVGVSREF